MKPVTHPSNTRTLNPPAGWDQDKLPVVSVPISDVRLGDVQAVATFWKPEPVELDALLLGGTVMLSVIGPTMPPVAVEVAMATEPHEPAGEPTREDLNALAQACAVPGHATMIDHLAFGRLVLARHARRAMENAYARRYLYLRERPLDSIAAGGLFVGRTPENLVINGEDLDRVIEERIAAEWPAAPALRFGLDREALRQDLGEALTTALAAACEDGIAPDWFDSRNVDEVLDELMPVIRMHVDPEMVNAAWSAAAPAPEGADAKCIACGCTDSRACIDGCSWAWVDREAQQGLCSSCVDVRLERAGEPQTQEPGVIPGLGIGLVPGVMRCARCSFRLHRVNLNVNVGTVTAGDSKTEPCPNGCGPLWPVTWEDEARQGWAIGEQLLERAISAEKLLAATRAPGFDPARAMNGELRTEMLDMLRCMARGDLAERIKDEPLKEIVGAIFTELSDADSDAQETPELRKRIEALKEELVAAADAPQQVAALNDRLIAANARIDALQLQLAKGGAA